MTERNKCGMYQIYFFTNFFRPMGNTKVINDKKLNKKTIGKLLSEIFMLDKQENENSIKKFSEENNISRFWSSTPINKFFLEKIVDFGQNIIIYWIILTESCNWLNNVG